jgi:hypothetical protein
VEANTSSSVLPTVVEASTSISRARGFARSGRHQRRGGGEARRAATITGTQAGRGGGRTVVAATRGAHRTSPQPQSWATPSGEETNERIRVGR